MNFNIANLLVTKCLRHVVFIAIGIMVSFAIVLAAYFLSQDHVEIWCRLSVAARYPENFACPGIVVSSERRTEYDSELGVYFSNLYCRFCVLHELGHIVSDEIAVAYVQRPSQWDNISKQYSVGTSHTVYYVRQQQLVLLTLFDLRLAGFVALTKLLSVFLIAFGVVELLLYYIVPFRIFEQPRHCNAP